MAFYRCGGGGIPSSLKTDMNAVLNKKFGTAVDYPPKQWPDDVNLLGPLPEGTASGPVANFSDGADDVPTKNVIATIAPTLAGVSSVNVTKTGRNILDFTVRSQYGITTTKGTDGGAIISGTASGGNVFVIDFVAMDLEAGKYNILVSGMSTGMTASWTKNGAYGGALNEGANVITLSQKTKIGGYVRITNGSSYPDPVSVYVQLTIGQDSETFEKYDPTVYAASLGRLIYGGSADLVNGAGKSTRIKKTVRWGDLGNVTQLADVTRKEIVLSASEEPKYITSSASADLLNDKNLPYDMTYSGNFEHIYIANSARILVYLPNGTDADTEITVSYTLTDALQTDFTFDGQEINTRLGYNAFWSDSGDTEVTYRADINLALGGQ